MPKYAHGFYIKDTKLVLNPKWADDVEFKTVWQISEKEVYTVVKNFFSNGEMLVACTNGKTYPDVFFVEQEKGK